ETAAALRATSRREGVTLFMALVAMWQALFSRYSGQHDIVVGTDVAGRGRIELEGVIGNFGNTLVLRTSVAGRPSFRERLARVRTVALDACAHQDAPFEWLVDELQPDRDLSRSPLVQVMLTLHNTAHRELRLDGIDATPMPIGIRTAKFDLALEWW